MNALQRGAAPALALACALATCSMEAAVKSVTAHASKVAHNKFTMPKQRKASGDSVSGRIEFNGFDGGSQGDSTSGSAGVERRRRARTPPSASGGDASSVSFISASGGSSASTGSKKRKSKSNGAVLERSLDAEFEQSGLEGVADAGAGADLVEGSGIGDRQPSPAPDGSGEESRDSEPVARLLCELEEVYPATEEIVSAVLEMKGAMERDAFQFDRRFLPGPDVKLSRNYRKAVKELVTRFKCPRPFAKCLLEMSRCIRIDMEVVNSDDGEEAWNLPAHLGLAITIAHIWMGTLRMPSPQRESPVVVDVSEARDGDESDGSSAGSMPMMQDDQGKDLDLGKLNLKGDARAQQKVLAYLTSDAVKTWMCTHGCAETLQGWVNDVCQLMEKNGVPTGLGQKVSPKSSKSPPAKGGSPPKVSGGAVSSGGVTTTKAKRRVTPNLVQQLGAGYRLGDVPSGPKVGEALPAVENRVGVGLLARREKHKEHVVSRAAAALTIPQTPGLIYSPSLLALTKLNEEMWELTRTVQKVLERRPDLSSLPKGERMRKATRMAAREIHKKEVQKIRDKQAKAIDGGGGGDDSSSSSSSSSSGGASGSSADESESVGDTVDSRERRSSDGGSDASSVCRSPFVVDDSSGSENSDDERDRDRKRRLKERSGSMNSLGTPTKPKGSAGAPVTSGATGHPGLLLLGDDGIKLWRMGTAKFNQGMNWVAYLHHKQAYDNYKQHNGKYSERTFKSVIHANLVPTVCAACGFERSRWDRLSDSKLIVALEKVLRPSRSTDFAVELRELKILRNSEEPLLARYEAFAEKFLYKCAEAEDAGKRIKWNVIKNAFSDAIRTEIVLKHWMQEVKWSGVAKAHKRLLRKLRESRSIEQLFHRGKAHLGGRAHMRDDAEEEGEDAPARERPPPKRRVQMGGKAKGNAARKVKAAERSAERAGGGRVNNAGVQTGRGQGGSRSSAPPPKGDKGPKLRQWKGYDKRGPSWHTDHDLYDCYDRPCGRPFCQRCRGHGHTAEYCRKPDDAPGLTREGYAEETAKGKAALRAPPPQRSGKHNGVKGGKQSRARFEDGSDEGDDADEPTRPAVNHQRGMLHQHDDSASDDDEEERRDHTSRKSGKAGRGNATRWRRRCL